LVGNGIDIGKYLSEEAKEAFKIKREITKKIWEGSGCINPKEYRKKYIKEVILGRTNKEKESRKQTKPERKVEEQLTALGIPYIREFTVLMHDYDFYLPDENILIEVDGDFWHPGDLSEAVYNFQKQNYINDIKKNCIAKAKGIDLFRIRESMINEMEWEELRNYIDDQIQLILDERKTKKEI
jgi:G:T-mismatch repair DNA endonuclease (very short patch repair protein)